MNTRSDHTTAGAGVGVALGLISALGFAAGPIFAILLYRLGFDWAPLLAWRFLIAAGLAWLVAVVVPVYRRDLATLPTREIAKLVALGILFVGSATTYYAAIVFVPVSVAVLVLNVSPALIAVFSLRLGLRLRGRQAWAALVVSMVGAFLAVVGPDIAIDLLGVSLALASAVLYAVWAMFAARSAGERRDGRVEGASSGAAVPIMFTATAVVLVGIVVIGPDSMSLAGMPAVGWLYLLGFALIGSLAGIQASYAAAARIGASRTAIVLTTEPIFSVAMAVLILEETLTPLHFLGGVLVVTGVLLLRIDLRSPAANPPSPSP